jgi:hypothetical protein
MECAGGAGSKNHYQGDDQDYLKGPAPHWK